MLECLLHNMAGMQRKEHQSCFWGPELEKAELAPEHPSVQTLLGSRDEENPEGGRTSLQGRGYCCTKCTSPQATGLVHEGAGPRICQMHGQGRSTEWGGVSRTLCKGLMMCPQSLHLMGLFPLIWMSWDRNSQAAEIDTPWDNQSWEGIPFLLAGIDLGCIGAPLLNAWAGTSHPPLVPHNLFLSPSSSATLWKTLICTQDPANLGAGHGKVTLPHWLRNQRNR